MSAMSKESMMTPSPMMLNTPASNGVMTLKCDLTPRPACMKISVVSTTMQAEIPHAIVPTAQRGRSMCPISQATVAR